MFDPLIQAARTGQKEITTAEAAMQLLNTSQQEAWGSLLTSLATSENIEGLILEPLKKAYLHEKEISEYLHLHGEDEVKHYRWLMAYVKENTKYVRTSKSFSDRIFYDGLLPKLAKLAKTNSTFLFSLMYFYELFTLEFYLKLKKAAQKDGLQNAILLFDRIRQDEIRHCVGAKNLITFSKFDRNWSKWDQWMLGLLLRIFQLDMATFWWCFHNKRVRKSTRLLGISSQEMWQMSNKALKGTLSLLKDMNS